MTRFAKNKLRFDDKFKAPIEYSDVECSASHIIACPSHKAREYKTCKHYFCRVEIGKRQVVTSFGSFVHRHVYITLPYAHGGVIESFSKDAYMTSQVTSMDFNSVLHAFELIDQR